MHTRALLRRLAIVLPLGAAATVAVLLAAQGADTPGDPLVAGFKSTYPASVSDAVELVTGKNGTMRYDMKLMTGANLVGRAVTALARPAPADQAGPALATKHSVEMIDEAKPGEEGVIVMEGTLDIAAMGQSVTATIDVMESKVHLKVLLPGMLGMFSGVIQAALQKKGSVLLEDHRD